MLGYKKWNGRFEKELNITYRNEKGYYWKAEEGISKVENRVEEIKQNVAQEKDKKEGSIII